MAQGPEGAVVMEIHSPAFAAHGEMPSRFTCEGSNSSPPLAWSGLPQGTKALALIVDDPDAPDPAAPRMTWVHWVVFNLPPAPALLGEGTKVWPVGARQGKNDWQKVGYGGPCPPIGRHRYFFKLYALDAELDVEHPTKAELEKAMEGHVLGKAEVIGTYQKKQR
jgi:Raf kinase inhibitor-like YbhB/YbcL family protein